MRNVIEVIKVITFCFIVNIFNPSAAQGIDTLVYEDQCLYGDIRIVPTSVAKAKRSSNQCTGAVIVNKSAANIPDSLSVALKIATDVWGGYLEEGDSLKVQVKYESMDGADIRTAVQYYSPDGVTAYPLCLMGKIL